MLNLCVRTPSKRSLFLLLSFFFSATASADPRISPGASIALDLAKFQNENSIGEIFGGCMYDEALRSLMPDLVGVAPLPNTQPDIETRQVSSTERQGTNEAWTGESFYYVNKSVHQYLDSPTAGFLSLEVEVDAYDHVFGRSEPMRATLEAEAPGAPSSQIDLKLSNGLPYLVVTKAGGETCVDNNWGDQACVSESRVTGARLEIPATFVNDEFWINAQTLRPTKKRFDNYRFTECVLNGF